MLRLHFFSELYSFVLESIPTYNDYNLNLAINYLFTNTVYVQTYYSKQIYSLKPLV